MADSEPDQKVAASAGGEPDTQPQQESADAEQQQRLEALRRYSVDTVPPDVRRAWIQAKQPLAPPERFQDTLPPNQQESTGLDAPPDAMSSTAPTVIIPRVRKRQRRTVVASVIGALTIIIAVLALLKLASRPVDSPESQPTQQPATTGAATFENSVSNAPAPEAAVAQPTSAAASSARSPKPAPSAKAIRPIDGSERPKSLTNSKAPEPPAPVPSSKPPSSKPDFRTPFIP